MRKYFYPVLLIGFAAFVGFILMFGKEKPNPVPALKMRNSTVALSGEWANTKKVIEGLVVAIKRNPDDNDSKLKLAQAYIQEARITGDHAYYDAAGLELVQQVLEDEPENFEALCCEATILLSQHHFEEALVVGEKAAKINPYNAYVFGILCDAHVELGNYPEAVKMADKMVSIRPDIRSYSRVSYLREIHGDMPGAIEAMDYAIKAGLPGMEQTAWARITLGHLYENTNNIQKAEEQYQIALVERPHYAYALAGLSNVYKAKGNYDAAVSKLLQAREILPDYSFSDQLTDVYQLNKQPEKASKMAEEVVNMLKPEDAGFFSSEDSPHGHYADRELAFAYLKAGNTDKALDHATIEYERRPNNIDVLDAMAWVHYKKGDYKKANQFIVKALRTKSQNPLLLYHAGMIKIKAGENKKGLALLEKAKSLNPNMHIWQSPETTTQLAIN